MRFRRFGCTNYKGFKGTVLIEVHPLTIFIGRNNSGKSALLRLPRLILRALSLRAPRSGFPLEVNELSFGRVFRDLVHAGVPHGSVTFDVDLEAADQSRLDLSATVQNVQVARPRSGEPGEFSVVSRWELRSPASRTLKWKPAQGAAIAYTGNDQHPVSFRGLLPESDSHWDFLEPWRRQIDEFEERITHLGPLRAAARPAYEVTASKPLGLTGEEAIGWLLHDKTLLDRVGDWFQEHLDGWRLGIDHGGSAFRCTLTRGTVTVNLADAGQGMQQILSVVVLQLSHGETGSFLDIVEQPELHMHSAAQAPLGDLFLNTAKKRTGTVLVETHSENLLLRIRRRIAEGTDPDVVALYWVDEHPDGYSTVQRIRIDHEGEVETWPQGVFSDGYEEVKALRRAARLRREGQI